MNKQIMTNWKKNGNGTATLIYSDGEKVTVDEKDFDRAFGTLINSTKEEIKRDFAKKS